MSKVSARLPYASWIGAYDCQIVTNWIPMPAYVDDTSGSQSSGMLPASSINISSGAGSRSPRISHSYAWDLRSLSKPAMTGDSRL